MLPSSYLHPLLVYPYFAHQTKADQLQPPAWFISNRNIRLVQLHFASVFFNPSILILIVIQLKYNCTLKTDGIMETLPFANNL